MQCEKLRTSSGMPPSRGRSPSMLCVLPEPVMPYASTAEL